MPKVKQTKVRQRSKARDLRKDELIEMMQDFKVCLVLLLLDLLCMWPV